MINKLDFESQKMKRMNLSYSLPGITRAGSKGMISARNIKAPH